MVTTVPPLHCTPTLLQISHNDNTSPTYRAEILENRHQVWLESSLTVATIPALDLRTTWLNILIYQNGSASISLLHDHISLLPGIGNGIWSWLSLVGQPQWKRTIYRSNEALNLCLKFPHILWCSQLVYSCDNVLFSLFFSPYNLLSGPKIHTGYFTSASRSYDIFPSQPFPAYPESSSSACLSSTEAIRDFSEQVPNYRSIH